MSEPKLCCNCLHCARWKKSTGVECHCDLNDKYLGYLQVMDEENDCKNWEKETKWDLEIEHDKKVRETAIEECINKLKLEFHPCLTCISYSTDECNTEDYFEDCCVTEKTISFEDIINFVKQLKEKNKCQQK